jgi:DNA-binding transcriptional MerR regulator
MGYTIKQVAEKMNLTVYTLRYYEKEGLLPFVQRDCTGNRSFNENDLEWLSLICCLKNTGMPIKQIKQYIDWCLDGDETLATRKKMLIEHRQDVLKQINELKKNLEKINYKISHYENCKGPAAAVATAEKVITAAANE